MIDILLHLPGSWPFKVPGWSRRCALHCRSIACTRPITLHQQGEKAEAEDTEIGGQVFLDRNRENGGKKFLGRRPPLLPTHLAHWCTASLVEDGGRPRCHHVRVRPAPAPPGGAEMQRQGLTRSWNVGLPTAPECKSPRAYMRLWKTGKAP